MARNKRAVWQKTLQEYWAYSRSPFQSILLILPVIVVYEFGMFLFNKSDVTGLRNGADVLLRHFLGIFGLSGFYAFGLSLFLIIFFVLWLEYQREGQFDIVPKFVLGMLLESFLFGFILFIVLARISSIGLQLNPSDGLSVIHRLILSLGAGVYEEFVFRVLVVSGVVFLLTKVARWEKLPANLIAILVSALVFSWFHYVGEYGDYFQIRTFLLRTFAGVLLSLLYVLRGFGITAYAHIFYDVIIIFVT